LDIAGRKAIETAFLHTIFCLVVSFLNGGSMNIKSLVIVALALASAVPLSAGPKKKKAAPRAMLERMESVPCGAKQRGLSGLGTIWASAGITHVNSDEKLCPQYLLRTDEMEYHVRPTDGKHPVVLPVGHEVEYKIKGDKMLVKVPDGDKKTRTYQVVAMNPTNPDTSAQDTSRPSSEKP
jgi:hypothetical protein